MKHTIFIFLLICGFPVFCAEGDISRDSAATEGAALTSDYSSAIAKVYQKPFSLSADTDVKSDYADNTFALQNVRIHQQGARKSPFRKFLYKQRDHIFFTGIGLAALLASGIFNSAAKSRYEKEQDLYDEYIGAEQGSDFDKLWDDYKDATKKTDRYINLRGIFGVAALAIGASLVISFAVEKEF
jgi:hypothetical protein